MQTQKSLEEKMLEAIEANCEIEYDSGGAKRAAAECAALALQTPSNPLYEAVQGVPELLVLAADALEAHAARNGNMNFIAPKMKYHASKLEKALAAQHTPSQVGEVERLVTREAVESLGKALVRCRKEIIGTAFREDVIPTHLIIAAFKALGLNIEEPKPDF